MNSEQIFTHYATLLDHLLREDGYWRAYFQAPFSCESIRVAKHTWLRSGVSRATLVDEEYDWVVKFDLDGASNTCARELCTYEDALAQEFDCYLCECRFLGVYRKVVEYWDWDKVGEWAWKEKDEFEEKIRQERFHLGKRKQIEIVLPLYGYKRATPYKFKFGLTWRDEDFCESHSRSPLVRCYKEIAVVFKEMYGVEEFERFSEFCENYGIDDLHTGNVGVIDGRFVVIDWAGF